MPKESPTILAVNPGSRYVGFAAFRGPDLIDWGVRVVSAGTPRGTVRVAGRILTEAVERFGPNTLAVKRLHASRSSAPLARLADSIWELSRRRKLEVYQYSITELTSALCPEGKANKRRLAAAMAATYPALSCDFQKEMTNRHPYHLRMFEAVALGVLCYRQTDQQANNH
jgi:Holliday junction resolvasome RuvABC endonuclease subunit